jgi:hypothetical protein
MRTTTAIVFLSVLASFAGAARATVVDITADVGDWMRQDNPTVNSNNLDLFVGSVGSNNALRGVAVFDLTSFSTTDTINGATVSVFHNDRDASNHRAGDATDTDVSIHLAAQIPTNAVSWNTYDGSNAWTTAGGDFGAALATTSANVDTIDLGDEVAFNNANLTTAIQAAVSNGDASIGFVVIAPGLESTGLRDFFAFQGDGRTPPNLNVIFEIPEPSTLSLAALGLLGLIGFGRRRKQ